MATVTNTKKPARRAGVRPASKAKASGARTATLIPPVGLSAAEFLKRLPPPSPEFDAEGVEQIIASRSKR
ncbi:MAG: hypothetical protein ABII82_20805 [Verrucomicrobiota bacterium]